MNLVQIPEQEFRVLRHDLRDHINAIQLCVQLVRDAIVDGDQVTSLRTLDQMMIALQKVNSHPFMSNGLPVESRHA